jgi:hypothetical protein
LNSRRSSKKDRSRRNVVLNRRKEIKVLEEKANELVGRIEQLRESSSDNDGNAMIRVDSFELFGKAN